MKRVIIGLISLSVLTLGFICFINYKQNKIETVITLENEISLNLSLNKKGEVLKIETLTDDSKQILDDYEFKKVSLEKLLDDLVSILIDKKYIDNYTIFLVNIDGLNDSDKVLNILNDSFEKNNIVGNVIMPTTDEIDSADALNYNITPIKAHYIKEKIANYPELNLESLKDKSIDEIDKIVFLEQARIDEEKRLEEERLEEERLALEEQKRLEEEEARKLAEAQRKKAEYEANYKKEQEELKKLLEKYSGSEEEIKEFLKKLKVVGLGDSVMLGAVDNLYKLFPNGYFDAKLNRRGGDVKNIMQNLVNNGTLGYPIVISAGTNGDCTEAIKNDIMKMAGDREVFWLTVTNDSVTKVNDKLVKYASKYNNLHIIDWASISSGHSEYFYKDGIHLTPTGRTAYANAVYYAIYKVYAEKFSQQQEEIVEQPIEIEDATINEDESTDLTLPEQSIEENDIEEIIEP